MQTVTSNKTTSNHAGHTDGAILGAAGAGLFSDHPNNEPKMEPIEKVNTSRSSDSLETEIGFSGQRFEKKQNSKSDEFTPAPLERRVTRPEIDDPGRKELQRIMTSMSKMSRSSTIAEPGDPAVDPSNDAFDFSKFLKMFRRFIESEGTELKQVSVVYKNLSVFGSGSALQLQNTIGDLFMTPFRIGEHIKLGKSSRKQILHGFDGIIKAGELCVVLGRPGSGCSTLLKALTGELHGLDSDDSEVYYNGIPQKKMIKEFKGETVYNQEVDKHFPHLTVGQ